MARIGAARLVSSAMAINLALSASEAKWFIEATIPAISIAEEALSAMANWENEPSRAIPIIFLTSVNSIVVTFLINRKISADL